ncbi:glycerophosphodiester phosphodiesterase [Candidatus Saccharibacteria bacterium]|nr:glycerophosphodiester phosphodiesterase [Candidatus Saccharibacteria bacterium]
MKKFEVIGHRGAKGLAPENSLKAIKRALACNVDMIEVDVRVDGGSLVLSHDPVIHTDKYDELEDALIEIDGDVPINLEIKEFDVVEHLPKVLKGYTGRILFSSFEFRILQEVKKVFPKAELAVLEKWSGVRAIAEASLLGTNRVHINQQWLWSGFVRSMKHRGFKLYAYTVNSRDRAEELIEWGVDGIFTDYPSLFSE